MNFPIADVVQTQSQGLPTIVELMSPGASALRESMGSGNQPRYRPSFLEFHSNFLENERTKANLGTIRTEDVARIDVPLAGNGKRR